MGRLLAVLGLLLAGMVLLPVGPAVACSCVTDQPDQFAENSQFAFVGVLQKQRADDHVVANRFTVESVLKGEVHRTQDVVTTPNPGDTCMVEWRTDAHMVVLGYLDEERRLASNLCSGSATSADPSYDAVVAALGRDAQRASLRVHLRE